MSFKTEEQALLNVEGALNVEKALHNGEQALLT